jgi:hypothetical protein
MLGQGRAVEQDKISFERLADWVEGRLSEEEARAVEARVAAADEATRAEVAWLRTFARVSEETVLEVPPAAVREELARRFEAYAEGRRSPGLLQRLVASLAFDSGVQPAFGVRSAAASGAAQRQLIFTTDAAEIALNVRPRPRDGSLDLDGQVFPAEDEDPASFSIQLLSGTDEIGMTGTDELGEFGFETVPPGTYQLLVGSERVEILISPIDL